MEIAKFALSCVLGAITISGFFAGIWSRHIKKMNDALLSARKDADAKVANAKAVAEQQIADARNDLGVELSKQDRRIEKLEESVEKLQTSITAGLERRLSNIEGEMKGMNNVLKSIQNWFIANTPRGNE